jgi:hypothetical protein
MSSTYSNSLRIELIGNGDQAGAWGTTTDSNLGYILDTAIAGYQTVSVTSASQALTYLSGATSTAGLNQSVYAMLRLTTTTAAAFAVYAPPVSKQYIIYNNSGYTATIYNSTVIGNTTAAGTGISIADGFAVQIWSDGTNFYNVDYNSAKTGNGAVVFSSAATLSAPTISSYANIKALMETTTVTASAPASTTNFDVAVQPVQYYTSAATANFTLNFRANAAATTTAGSFTIGATYTIASVGTTNFTAIGATSNAVEVVFVATGVGSGTGTATTAGTLNSIMSTGQAVTCKFLVTNGAASTVTAGSFTIGKTYKIASIGTTDFTAIGAASNTVGVTFTATGIGTGTGTATTTGFYPNVVQVDGTTVSPVWQGGAPTVGTLNSVDEYIFLIVKTGSAAFSIFASSAATAASVVTPISNGGTGATTQSGAVAALGLVGPGQVWTDVTASRAFGTTYTNSTSRPILVMVGVSSSGNSYVRLDIDSVLFGYSGAPSGGVGGVSILSFYVPVGSTYKVSTATGTNICSAWNEYR